MKKAIFVNILLVGGGIFFSFIIGELLLRILPIPGINFECLKYDEFNGSIYYPHCTLIYRNKRVGCIKRRTNSIGFPDDEHKREKLPLIYRIGFFGDSYTEALQVPIEDTFFKTIERDLKHYNVECLSFGHSGFGTLHSYLTCKKWHWYYDIDLVVYVFCENDLGDNVKEISGVSFYPSAILTQDGFKIDYSFRELYKYKTTKWFKILDYLTAHSLIFATISSRTKLLLKYGIKRKVKLEERKMATKSHKAIPDQNALPSTWPEEWRSYVEKLGERIIVKWKEMLERRNKKFVILYIPRESEIEKPDEEQDSWKLWLKNVCKKEKIYFIDPTPELLKKIKQGKEVFYDHLTSEGHKAVAESFIREFPEIIKEKINLKAKPQIDVRFYFGNQPNIYVEFFDNPAYNCNLYMYESDFEFLKFHKHTDSKVVLYHRIKKTPWVIIKTVIIPEANNTVEIVAKPQLDKGNYPEKEFPKEIPVPNLCCRLNHSPAFATVSRNPLPEFITRCFIFTKNGMTFLDRTKRHKISQDKEEEIPLVQTYLHLDKKISMQKEKQWAGISSDRYIVPVIGVVSKNRKYLLAIVNDSSFKMCQAWFCCLHNNPEWLPKNAPWPQRKWRIKIYAMENNVSLLFKKIIKDFPQLSKYRKYFRK